MAISTFPALVSETNGLLKLYDAAADVPGTMCSVWESESPASVDVLHAFAHERHMEIVRRPFTDETGRGFDAFEITFPNGTTITAYR